jgi:hypothetical protein
MTLVSLSRRQISWFFSEEETSESEFASAHESESESAYEHEYAHEYEYEYQEELSLIHADCDLIGWTEFPLSSHSDDLVSSYLMAFTQTLNSLTDSLLNGSANPLRPR